MGFEKGSRILRSDIQSVLDNIIAGRSQYGLSAFSLSLSSNAKASEANAMRNACINTVLYTSPSSVEPPAVSAGELIRSDWGKRIKQVSDDMKNRLRCKTNCQGICLGCGNFCYGGCSGGCYGSCSGGCRSWPWSACGCQGSDGAGCSSTCRRDCYTMCEGSCTTLCQTSCKDSSSTSSGRLSGSGIDGVSGT